MLFRSLHRDVVPPAVVERPKQPYRAPDIPAFFTPEMVWYARELLDEPALAHTGLFDARSVAGLVRRCRAGGGDTVGFRENQAFVAILSTQLWYHQFMTAPCADGAGAPPRADVALVERAAVSG